MKPATMPPANASRMPSAPPGRDVGRLPSTADDAAPDAVAIPGGAAPAFDETLRTRARQRAGHGAGGAGATHPRGARTEEPPATDGMVRHVATGMTDALTEGMADEMADGLSPRDDGLAALAVSTSAPSPATPSMQQGAVQQRQAGRWAADRETTVRASMTPTAWAAPTASSDGDSAAVHDDAMSARDVTARGEAIIRDAARLQRQAVAAAAAGDAPAPPDGTRGSGHFAAAPAITGRAAALRWHRAATGADGTATDARSFPATQGGEHRADAAEAHTLREPGRARGRAGFHLSELAVPWRQEVQVLSASRQDFLPPLQQGMAGLSAVSMSSTPATLFGAASDATWAGAAGQVLKALRQDMLPGMAGGVGGMARLGGAKTLRRLQIQLHPASLGTVSAQLALVGGRMEITIRVPDRRMIEHLRPGLDGLLQRLRGADEAAARANVQLIVDPSLAPTTQDRAAAPQHAPFSGGWQGASGGAPQQGAGQFGSQFGEHVGNGAGATRDDGQAERDVGRAGEADDEGMGQAGGAAAGTVYL